MSEEESPATRGLPPVTAEALTEAIQTIDTYTADIDNPTHIRIFNQARDDLLLDVSRHIESDPDLIIHAFTNLIISHITHHRTQQTITKAITDFLDRIEDRVTQQEANIILQWIEDKTHYEDPRTNRTPLYSRFKVLYAKIMKSHLDSEPPTDQVQNDEELEAQDEVQQVEPNRDNQDENEDEANTAHFIPVEDIADLRGPSPVPRTRFRLPDSRLPRRSPTMQPTHSHRYTPTDNTHRDILPQDPALNLYNHQMAAMAAEITRMARTVNTLAAAQKPNKSVSLPTFSGKVDEVESFISSISRHMQPTIGMTNLTTLVNYHSIFSHPKRISMHNPSLKSTKSHNSLEEQQHYGGRTFKTNQSHSAITKRSLDNNHDTTDQDGDTYRLQTDSSMLFARNSGASLTYQMPK